METILLIEPNLDTSNYLQGKLSSSGYQAVAVESVNEAMEVIGQKEANIIISEYHLKDSSIDLLCSRLKEENTIRLPIILITNEKRTPKFEGK